jgi:hypothetical protein
MHKLQKALVMTAAIAVQGLAVPATTLAADLFAGQSLLPKSASTAECQRGGRGGGGAGARPAGGGARASGGAAAQRGHAGGGANAGGRNVRTNASSNVNRGANVNSNRNVNRNTNVNRNVNVNVNGGGYGYNDGWDYHPVARGMAFGAAAAVTAAAIGSVVYSVPPSCSTVIVNGVSYSQCGSTWYAPRYAGTTVEYVVVNPPG